MRDDRRRAQGVPGVGNATTSPPSGNASRRRRARPRRSAPAADRIPARSGGRSRLPGDETGRGKTGSTSSAGNATTRRTNATVRPPASRIGSFPLAASYQQEVSRAGGTWPYRSVAQRSMRTSQRRTPSNARIPCRYHGSSARSSRAAASDPARTTGAAPPTSGSGPPSAMKPASTRRRVLVPARPPARALREIPVRLRVRADRERRSHALALPFLWRPARAGALDPSRTLPAIPVSPCPDGRRPRTRRDGAAPASARAMRGLSGQPLASRPRWPEKSVRTRPGQRGRPPVASPASTIAGSAVRDAARRIGAPASSTSQRVPDSGGHVVAEPWM